MKLGLGSGTTAEAFVECLAPRVKGGLAITAVPTSQRTAELARSLSIPLADLDQLAPLDLTIDGADETDASLTLIKGGGAALFREKIVAASSKRMVVIADRSKLVKRLGKFPLPIEVATFGHETTARRIRQTLGKLGYARVSPKLRMRDGEPVKTDSNNLIYDCPMGAIKSARLLANALSQVVGVVEHGLFVGLASVLVLAGEDGVEVIRGKPHGV